MIFPVDWSEKISLLRRTPGLVTRFAPSPTGYLHLGHVVNMIFVWGVARAVGARIILRMEDHDRGRCRPEYEQAVFTDLAWLGFTADLGITSATEQPSAFRQSDNRRIYDDAQERLKAAGYQVYPCTCSRKEILQRAPQAEAAEELWYDGHCRRHQQASTAPHGIRVALPAEVVHFADLWLGPLSQTPAKQCGDLLLRDRDGFDTYQAAVVVDDARHRVNLVIRGQDLTHSTGRQILLAHMLQRTDVMHFLHHPLLLDGDGRKLSKRQWAVAIGARRQQGTTAHEILGEAAFMLGLTARSQAMSAEQVMELVVP